MLDGLKKVADFCTTGGGEQQDNLFDYNLLNLKLGLIEEEVKELRDAAIKGDREEMLDALADIAYVLYGFAWTYKLDDVLPEAFTRVHDSNMSKFPMTESEANATIQQYYQNGISTFSKKVGDKFVIMRRGDNKILKSINYKAVNLEDLC